MIMNIIHRGDVELCKDLQISNGTV